MFLAQAAKMERLAARSRDPETRTRPIGKRPAASDLQACGRFAGIDDCPRQLDICLNIQRPALRSAARASHSSASRRARAFICWSLVSSAVTRKDEAFARQAPQFGHNLNYMSLMREIISSAPARPSPHSASRSSRPSQRALRLADARDARTVDFEVAR